MRVGHAPWQMPGDVVSELELEGAGADARRVLI